MSEAPAEDGARASRAIKPRTIAPVQSDGRARSRIRLARWTRAAAAALGLRPSLVVDGVRYRERTPESLRRALSVRGRGWKEYDVRFPSARGTRIRATPHRVYADLVGPLRTRVYERLTRTVRPGERLLDLCAGTGSGASTLSHRVGPSGAVIALETDHESLRYARRRHRIANVAYEFGGVETLEGELDASFDTVVAVDPPIELGERDDIDPAKEQKAIALLSELWRVVIPGGRLAIAAAEPGDTPPPSLWRPATTLPAGELDRLIERACGVDASDPSAIELAELSGRSLRIVTKPEPKPRRSPPTQPPPLPPPHG